MLTPQALAQPPAQPLIAFSSLLVEPPPPFIETPLLERREKCAWCWSKRHPDQPYPEEWSSTLCSDCEKAVQAQLEARRKLKMQTKQEAQSIEAEQDAGQQRMTTAPATSLNRKEITLHQQHRQQVRPYRPTWERIGGYRQALFRRRRFVLNLQAIYTHEPMLSQTQVQATVSRLSEIRRVVLAAYHFLDKRLSPEQTKRLCPYGCITRLYDLDDRLTTIILEAAMFAPVCQAISQDRVSLHKSIRSAFPALVAAYDDTIAMLSALGEKAKDEATYPILEEHSVHVLPSGEEETR